VPQAGEVFVSATGTNKVYAINEKSFAIMAKIPAGYFPDGISYAPGVKRIFVSDEFGKSVSVIDVGSLRLIRTIRLNGTVGNTHFDRVSGRIVTADEGANQLWEIDPSTLRIVEKTELPGCRGAHGFVIGRSPHFAYVTGEDNASLVVVDLDDRRVVQKFTVGSGPDVLALDEGLKLLYVTSESGVVSVFRIAREGLSMICEGKLWEHAHTVCIDQSTHRAYFPLQNYHGYPVLRIMIPAPDDSGSR